MSIIFTEEMADYERKNIVFILLLSFKGCPQTLVQITTDCF